MRRVTLSRSFCFVACGVMLLAGGCVGGSDTLQPSNPPAPVGSNDVAGEPPGPLMDGPGVEVIQMEPAPPERVYICDPGYPPGTYFYDDYYWYGGYRYERTVFITRVVYVNAHENRYVNVEQNKRKTQQIQQADSAKYAAANHSNLNPKPNPLLKHPPQDPPDAAAKPNTNPKTNAGDRKDKKSPPQ